jgi:c-di-GMP-binding flagellar brake protein YcgR
MKERREYPRFGVSFPVECTILPERKKYFYTVSKDLSMVGVRILSEDFLPRKKFMKVNINLIDTVAEIKAQVVWCNKEPYSRRYYAGLKFLEINEKNKHNLGTFLGRIRRT